MKIQKHFGPKASSSAGGESGDIGGGHACGLPRAPPKCLQPNVSLQHQDPPGESQSVPNTQHFQSPPSPYIFEGIEWIFFPIF